MNVVIFGTGTAAENALIQMDWKKVKLVAVIDNDMKKIGEEFQGKIINNPRNIHNFEFDYIIILSSYYKNMKKQLLNLGVCEKKILCWYYYNDDDEYNREYNCEMLQKIYKEKTYYFEKNRNLLNENMIYLNSGQTKIKNLEKFNIMNKKFYNNNYNGKHGNFAESLEDKLYCMNIIKELLKDIELLGYRLNKNDNVLDIGCSTGTFCECFEEIGYKVTGIDYSDIAINKAKKRNLKCEFMVMDALNPVLNKKYNMIFMRGLSIVINTHDLNFLVDLINKYYLLLNKKGILTIAFTSNFSGIESNMETVNLTYNEIDTIIEKSKFKNKYIFYCEEKFIRLKKFNEKVMVYLTLIK